VYYKFSTTLFIIIIKTTMVLPIIKQVIMYFPNKIIAINSNVNTVINLPESADKAFTYITKVTGATAGSAGVAKGSADLVEALACQDGICAVISGIGLAADGLQICTSFVPGPNVTVIITMPVSVGCKVFVWCCKKSKLPWRSC
jgi:hypothetical protein